MADEDWKKELRRLMNPRQSGGQGKGTGRESAGGSAKRKTAGP
jgi:hypothetical protein